MNYIDLTYNLKDKSPIYPGDPEFRLNNTIKNENYSLFKIKANLHTGTHIDAPYHYFKNGKKVSEIKIKNLIGNANILERKKSTYHNTNKNTLKNYFTNNKINIDDLKNIENKMENIIILKTGWSNKWENKNYFTNNPYISKELAKLFVENEISGLAIDSPSVDKYEENKIHKILLKNDIWIVENLTNTNKLTKNKYFSYFIPMNITAEASFVRAFVKL